MSGWKGAYSIDDSGICPKRKFGSYTGNGETTQGKEVYTILQKSE